MSHPYFGALERDDEGDLPREQDHQLPEGDMEKIQDALAAGGDDLFERMHENCEAPWVCYSCGRKVCPRCDPSPAEFIKCAECDWFSGGAA